MEFKKLLEKKRKDDADKKLNEQKEREKKRKHIDDGFAGIKARIVKELEKLNNVVVGPFEQFLSVTLANSSHFAYITLKSKIPGTVGYRIADFSIDIGVDRGVRYSDDCNPQDVEYNDVVATVYNHRSVEKEPCARISAYTFYDEFEDSFAKFWDKFQNALAERLK